MSHEVLLYILEDLTDDEFKRFRWYLKMDKASNMQPIPASRLEKAERHDVVDLMMQNYQVAGAVEVTTDILKKISRNDLVAKLGSKTSGAAGPGPGGALGPPAEDKVPADKRLLSVRKKFIAGVSEAVLNQLLDELIEREVITDEEMDSVRTNASKADKARDLIDTVRRKGAAPSSELIAALCEVDPCLSKQLNLI